MRPTRPRPAAGELAQWVRGRFEAGWRRLRVVDTGTGRRVGWIGRDPRTGARSWQAADPWPDYLDERTSTKETDHADL